MKVFKFGGASVKDTASLRNMVYVLKNYNEPLVVVVSAMGKTTNALEEVLQSFFQQNGNLLVNFNKVRDYHFQILKDLFKPVAKVFEDIEELFKTLFQKLQEEPSMTYNYEYDQIVPYGELFSTVIVEAFLNQEGIACKLTDIRKCLKTDNNFREAHVDFDLSERLVRKVFNFKDSKIYITQGFIGSDRDNLSTTLGREGSDYTAALLAYFLDAESVTVWKDVPGVLNADPKWFDNTVKIDKLTYTDAIELAFYGASVIHPKTIQPLKQKNIPLYVKSFLEPKTSGTMIGNIEYSNLIPCFIFKMDQVLIDIYPDDLSFIAEENLQYIFAAFAAFGLKINLMQNTAVRFRICVNNDSERIANVKKKLAERYHISVLSGLELITIRYYDRETISRVMVNKEFILEQKGKATIQLLVKDLGIL
jgi:aspartate kinase